MTYPTPTVKNTHQDALSTNGLPAEHSDSDDLNHATLTDALEQTIFENFDDGIYIGIMSGTSLDGMDVVLCQFSDADSKISSPMQLLATHSQDFPPRLREVLLALCHPNGVSKLISQDNEPDDKSGELEWLGWASRVYGEFASSVVNTLLQQADIDPESVLAIGCHGQTVRHRPNLGFTLQLVDPSIIAERTGISVVSDFRRRDMAVGGQGAPLVPAFHHALFASPNVTRVLLNLGGIANITVLPATNSDESDSQVIGYDTGPANLLLDTWATLHLGKSYDADGAWAQTGRVVEPLLNQLLSHSFFANPYPKSTGREEFNVAWLQNELQVFDKAAANTRYSSADVQATLTELTAITASNQIRQFTKTTDTTIEDETAEVYVCGGGALNSYLMTRLQAHLPHCTVSTTTSLGLNPTWVEAVAFAWLARQTLMGETGNLPAVTGASKGVVLGQICFA